MGTKVHSESYFPRYYSMRNLSEDSNGGSLPLFYGDKTLANGQYYNAYLPRAAADGGGKYSGCEKDLVKQKMLEHETIFKSQVYELHRLYKIQRDLIDDVKRKELHTYHRPVEGSVSSNPLGFQRPFEEVQNWHKPIFPLVNSSGARALASSAETSQSHLSSVGNKSLQIGLAESQNGDISPDCEILGSRPTKVRRKMFDLQLPANAYIDTDEVEQTGNKRVADNGDVRLLTASSRSGIGLANLNEPFEGEEANTSVSRDSLGNTPCMFWPSGTSQKLNVEKNNATPIIPHTENKGSGREWMSYMFEGGHPKNNLISDSQGFQLEKLPQNFQPLQGMFHKAQNLESIPRTDQNNDDFWKDRMMPSSRFSERNDSSHANQFASSYDLPKSWSQFVTSWEKPISNNNQQSMLVESHPCFSMSPKLSSSQSSAQSPSIFGQKLHMNGYSRSNLVYKSDVLNRNGLCQGSSSGSKSHFTSTGFDSINLNNGSNVTDEKVNHISTQYFNGSSNHIDLNSTNHIKLDMMLSRSSKPLLEDIEAENAQGKSFIQIITSTPISGDARSNRIFTGDCPANLKILGFPIFAEKVKKFDEDKDGLFDINCPYEPVDSELGNDENTNSVEKVQEKEVTGMNLLIDLNSCISDDEGLLSPSKSYSDVKKIIEIDIEAPLPPESSQEDILFTEASQISLLHTTVQTLNQDECDTFAAEAIVALSSCGYHKQSRHDICPSDEALMDPLRWFADVISSCVDDHVMGKQGDNKNVTLSNGLDYFESMTLKLIEVNIDECYLSEFLTRKNPKVEETGTKLTSRRKGQARRGRQKRDFQRDILPGIASLSRHDVREDLHTFEGLVKATGDTWYSSLSRRAAATAKRGRRRTAATTVVTTVVAASPICSPVIPKVNNIIEMGWEDRSLTGWGKTTRRPRRQRGPVGNPHPCAPLP